MSNQKKQEIAYLNHESLSENSKNLLNSILPEETIAINHYFSLLDSNKNDFISLKKIKEPGSFSVYANDSYAMNKNKLDVLKQKNVIFFSSNYELWTTYLNLNPSIDFTKTLSEKGNESIGHYLCYNTTSQKIEQIKWLESQDWYYSLKNEFGISPATLVVFHIIKSYYDSDNSLQSFVIKNWIKNCDEKDVDFIKKTFGTKFLSKLVELSLSKNPYGLNYIEPEIFSFLTSEKYTSTQIDLIIENQKKQANKTKKTTEEENKEYQERQKKLKKEQNSSITPEDFVLLHKKGCSFFNYNEEAKKIDFEKDSKFVDLLDHSKIFGGGGKKLQEWYEDIYIKYFEVLKEEKDSEYCQKIKQHFENNLKWLEFFTNTPSKTPSSANGENYYYTSLITRFLKERNEGELFFGCPPQFMIFNADRAYRAFHEMTTLDKETKINIFQEKDPNGISLQHLYLKNSLSQAITEKFEREMEQNYFSRKMEDEFIYTYFNNLFSKNNLSSLKENHIYNFLDFFVSKDKKISKEYYYNRLNKGNYDEHFKNLIKKNKKSVPFLFHVRYKSMIDNIRQGGLCIDLKQEETEPQILIFIQQMIFCKTLEKTVNISKENKSSNEQTLSPRKADDGQFFSYVYDKSELDKKYNLITQEAPKEFEGKYNFSTELKLLESIKETIKKAYEHQSMLIEIEETWKNKPKEEKNKKTMRF